jgi:hypothetical protein
VAFADGVRLKEEEQAINKILKHENISESMYQKFIADSERLSVDEMHQIGIEAIEKCQPTDRLRAYGWIYKIMGVNGRVDVREAKFLLYALKDSDIRAG